jgi:hypothetical protein
MALASTAKRAMAATAVGPRARQLANAIAAEVPDACLPGVGDRPAAPPRQPLSPSKRARQVPATVWLAAAIAVALIATVVMLGQRHRPAVARAVVPPTDATKPKCPPVTAQLQADLDEDGCAEALTFVAGVVSSPLGRFRVGAEGDRAATGRWTCDGPATLALLRPDGDVFVADNWATPGDDVVLRLVGTVPGAVDIGAADTDNDGCDEVMVRAANGAVTPLRAKEVP